MKTVLITLGALVALFVAFLVFGQVARSGRTPDQNAEVDAIRACHKVRKAMANSPEWVDGCAQMERDYEAKWGDQP
ncbi:hypothetical protein [Luteibacter sp.]|uniref:hypothetical protein n=1 Tax=Luteibacter sp. TaxID=1886636 RepID=UPI0028090CD5|nr:hypothetical protein [Luteibacter sp.]MDQ8051059.1 hypothetical protein [Luteibacter sp.]